MISAKEFKTIEEQIKVLESKGITFNFVSKEDAKKYLRNNNNYFKVTSYRKNYPKIENGENNGKYIDLDFGNLKDLAIIDMELRYLVIQFALDIEHFIKLRLLQEAEAHHEDGYAICIDYVNSLSFDQKVILSSELKRCESSVYCGELYAKYKEHMPLWVFLELISFGRLTAFYHFCALRYNSKEMSDIHFILKTCKDIRNAAAHSNCILNNLLPNTAQVRTRNSVSKALSNINCFSKDIRKRRMSNARIQQFVTLLYAYMTIVSSEGMQLSAKKKVEKFKNRMMKHIHFYQSNELIFSTFNFLQVIVDNWFPAQ